MTERARPGRRQDLALVVGVLAFAALGSLGCWHDVVLPNVEVASTCGNGVDAEAR